MPVNSPPSTPLDVSGEERATLDAAFDAFDRLENVLKKPNKGRGRGKAE